MNTAVIFRWAELMSGRKGGRKNTGRSRLKYHLVVWPARACHKRSVSVSPSSETERVFTDSLAEEWCIIT